MSNISALKHANYFNLPSSPGVYFFRDQHGKILYIGKAINLKRRVSSYFQSAGGRTGVDARIQEMVSKIARIDYRKTESAIEALILEANLIKKYLPFYNVKLKDDKSFVNIVISREEFPRIFVVRLNVNRLYYGVRNTPWQATGIWRTIENVSAERKHIVKNPPGYPALKAQGRVHNKIGIKRSFGPYTSAKTARTALKILRRVFPFRGLEKTKQAERFYREIMAIPENKEKYRESVRNITLFLQGKKKRIISNLNKKMEMFSREEKYEDAARIRNQIFALRHLQDTALLKNSDWQEDLGIDKNIPVRIEAYDISNIFGEYATGSMVVFVNGKADTDEYRHFRIKTIKGISDIAMLEEVLMRRFRHNEWRFPDMVVIDGGLGQLNIAKKVLKSYNLNIPVIAIAKGPDRKGEKIFMAKGAPLADKKIIVAIRDEAHRFAIGYHRKLKRKNIFT